MFFKKAIFIDNYYYFSIARYFSGISIGIDKSIDRADIIENLKVYPNPATKEFNFKFYLNKSSMVSVYLTDISGKIMKSIIENEKKASIPSNNK